ncbi:MAG: tetratricopeptide repeat protein [Acidobacteria bacterium]|nr:tetratricopeptide repeat protein [Acidobacteriota bacterium]
MTIALLFWFALAITPAALGAQQKAVQRTNQAGAEQALNSALGAYRAGRLDAAIARAREADALLPQNPQIRLHLGLFLYEKSADSLEAQSLMESVLDKFPSNNDLALRLLNSYLLTGGDAKAGQLLERLRERMKADSRFAFNVVYTLIHHSRYPQAKNEIDQISKSLQGEVLFIGGLIEFGTGRNKVAVDLFQRAGQLGFPPPDSRQMLTLAAAYFRLREFPQAAQEYEAFFSHHSDALPEQRFQLGLCYYGYGDFNRALQQMLEVRKVAPKMPEVNLYLASILIELRRPEEARPYLSAELERDAASFKSMTKLAYLEYLAGNDELCRRWLDQSISGDPSWFETHMVFGLLYSRLGDYEKAVQSLEACLKAEPEYPKAHYQLSQAYRRLGNEEKAKQFLESYTRLQNAVTARTQEALGMRDKAPE